MPPSASGDVGAPPTAAILLYPGCAVAEVAEVATRLGALRADVAWVHTGVDSVRDASGLELRADQAVSQRLRTAPDLLVIPGGDPASVLGDESVRRLVRAVADSGIVASICAGTLVLGDAGILAGRRITHNYRPPWAPPEVASHVAHLLSTASTEDDRTIGVVTDGNIVTALPNATAEFSTTVCHVAGLIDRSRANLLTRHLRGGFVPELYPHRVDS